MYFCNCFFSRETFLVSLFDFREFGSESCFVRQDESFFWLSKNPLDSIDSEHLFSQKITQHARGGWYMTILIQSVEFNLVVHYVLPSVRKKTQMLWDSIEVV